jgi:hypothetical protein
MEMYRPFAQTAVGGFTLVIKADGEPSALGAAARTAVKAVDPNLPVYDMRTMEERISGSFAQTRGTMMLLLVTAVLAALLSGVAIYGSIWYSVSQRVPEIGVRLALGASRASIFLDVLRHAVVLTGIGSALGLAASLAAGAPPLGPSLPDDRHGSRHTRRCHRRDDDARGRSRPGPGQARDTGGSDDGSQKRVGTWGPGDLGTVP